METGIDAFNLRVYGLLIKDRKVLITDEHRGGILMTKFPGGGLEKGEGIEACLEREFYEELEMTIKVKRLFYVNDFFQRSAFRSTDQLLSFYYLIDSDQIDLIPKPTDMNLLQPNEQGFRWVDIENVQHSDFTFPIDREVVKILKTETE